VLRTMKHPARWLPLLGLVVCGALPLAAQIRVPKTDSVPVSNTPPPGSTAVTSLTATGYKGMIFLEWPPASRAISYRVTRAVTPGGSEVQIYEGPPGNFVFEAKDCSLTPVAGHSPNCVYPDEKVKKGTTYSYRVWTLAGPSPAATAQAQ